MPQSQDQTKASSGGQEIEGCLQGSAGNYMLTDKNGATWQLQGDTASLADHVGHDVKITGTAGSAAPGQPSSAGAAGSSGQQTLTVQKVKHVSKTCKTAGGK